MQNKKTTISGYLILLASLATLVAHFLTTGLSGVDVTAVVTAVTGIGLISAQDGGH